MNTIKPIMAASASPPQFDPSAVIIRMPELEVLTGLKRPTIYKRLKDDPTFPRPVPLSDSPSRGAPVGFVLAEVQEWVRKRIALRGGGGLNDGQEKGRPTGQPRTLCPRLQPGA